MVNLKIDLSPNKSFKNENNLHDVKKYFVNKSMIKIKQKNIIYMNRIKRSNR